MLSQKANILCLLRVLEAYSDGEHILTMEQIQSHLRKDYGLELSRKAVYASLGVLTDFGYDISAYSENGVGYYLREREFEPSEIHLLADAVYSSGVIPESATRRLITKLGKTQSVHFAGRLSPLTLIKPEVKSANTEIFYNIELLGEAVRDGAAVCFDYLRYDLKKRLVPRRAEKYVVTPYAIVWANERYYLICHYARYQGISHLRIDKIKGISLAKEPPVPAPKGFSPYEYAKSAIYMYGKEQGRVTLLCDMEILDDVIDRFGKSTRLEDAGDGQFKAVVTASLDGIRFWALQYLRHCQVLSPQGLRADIAALLREQSGKYCGSAPLL